MECTHIIDKKRPVAYLTVKHEIDIPKIEYTIQYMIQEKRPVINNKSVVEEIKRGLYDCGLAYWDGLLGTDYISADFTSSDYISSDAINLAKKLFPSFYKQLPVGSKG